MVSPHIITTTTTTTTTTTATATTTTTNNNNNNTISVIWRNPNNLLSLSRLNEKFPEYIYN